MRSKKNMLLSVQSAKLQLVESCCTGIIFGEEKFSTPLKQSSVGPTILMR